MSLAIYPSFLATSGWGLTFTVTRTPNFSTTKQDAPNGFQVRVQNYQQPKYGWILIYDYLSASNTAYKAAPSPFQNYAVMQNLLGFFNAHLGSGVTFLYPDPNFYSVGPGITGVSTPNPLAELQVVVDGSGNSYSPLQIHYGGTSGTDQSAGFYEDVFDLQPAGGLDHSALSIYDNGTLKTFGTDYVLAGPGLAVPGASFLGLYVAFTYTPTGPITATFSFYYPVIFDMDALDIEQFSAFLHTIGGSQAKNGSGQLKLISAFPASV
jgi:hypothetical protein